MYFITCFVHCELMFIIKEKEQYLKRCLKLWSFLLVILYQCVAYSTLHAQVVEKRSFVISAMKPSYTVHGILGSTSAMIPQRNFGVNLAFGWEYERLVPSYQGVITDPLIQHRVMSHLQGWWRANQWLMVGASLPITLFQNREQSHGLYGSLDSLENLIWGDLLLSTKVRIPLSDSKYSLGAQIDVSLPTAVSDDYVSQNFYLDQVSILYDYRWSRAHLIGNLGYKNVQAYSIFNVASQDLVNTDLALRVLLNKQKTWSIESMLHYHTAAAQRETHQNELYTRLGLAKLWTSSRDSSLKGSQFKLSIYADKAFIFDVMTPQWQAGAYLQWQSPKVIKDKTKVKIVTIIKSKQENDGDTDGILDHIDRCPTIKGHLDTQGCPLNDVDGDKVLNHRDLCKYTYGLTNNRGCPKLALALEELIKNPILFNNERSELNKTSKRQIRFIAKVLQRHPQVRIHIAGHSDYLGNDQFNMILSKLRCNKVYGALIQAGISPHRITQSYFGELYPVIRTVNPEDRKANRRVVISWILPHVPPHSAKE
jgi:outer membrane protein OmpA-like peptidoglycan-associated protein